MNSKLPLRNSVTRRAPSWTRALVFIALAVAATGAVAQQTNSPSGLNFDSFKIVVDRDIFNQNRLPHERAVRPAPVADSFSLVGTLFYAGGDIAFFDGTRDEYRQALKTGGEIAGFKVTAVTLDSVTLSDGTNQTILKITTQMRRDDAGHWTVSTDRASYASAGTASGPKSQGSSRRSQRYNSTRNSFTAINQSATENGGVDNLSPPGAEEPPPEMENNPPPASGSGGGDDALARLMQRRAQEEQQLRQGQ